ncbi:MAG: protein-S-isoprenylcysteine methyltransferase [Alphaproteobacteria bacterium]|nr:protein-S-isoprenylcysteine methyltransferase [Alphaproteobacteria bacterium]MBV9372748.1 protein-S-isoprenylcysteine methyltransferase [Alphaproteobacteria bacterium]MBV9900903.1 protein-S-isoprenylcysteine methyltransferase [Alphaproteobacteria bacterium]
MNAEVKIASELRRDERPRSAVSAMVGAVGFAGLIAWLAVARAFEYSGPRASLCAVLACGVPMILWSILVDKVHRNPGNGIDWQAPPRPLSASLDYSLVKIAGLWTTWAAIAFLYGMARWYWSDPYLFTMTVFGWAAVPLLAVSVPYVIWIDRRLVDPRDGAWHFGQLVIGRSALADREAVFEHLRCWAIKAFFLAFMVAIVPGNWFEAVAPRSDQIAGNLGELTRWLIAMMFMLDVTFATVGYVLTLKPLDAHIRSANPYAAGWMAALICYPPFILMRDGGPINYHPATLGENGWAYWLDGYPLLMTLVAFLLVALTAIYAWATIAFGIRFSNLTHRGILTHGPYAWTKHPAYVSKNLYWWLATLPFFATSGDMTDMVRNTFMLGVVSGVYYWRAKTEERHLGADPAYRDYADWMARHGPVTRLLGLFSRRRAPAPLPAE